MISVVQRSESHTTICTRNLETETSRAKIDIVDHDPQSGHLFVFFNKRRDKMKALIWEASGYWLLYKRIEHGRFHIFDRVSDRDDRFELSSTELALIMDGIDLRGSKKRITHDELHTKA